MPCRMSRPLFVGMGWAVAGLEVHVQSRGVISMSCLCRLSCCFVRIRVVELSSLSLFSSRTFARFTLQIISAFTLLQSRQTSPPHTQTMRLLAPALLLAATTLSTTLAKPLPISMDEIQRRWSQGESEVCCTPLGPGCYISAWFRSLGKGRRGEGVRLPVCSLSPPPTPNRTLCETQTNDVFCVLGVDSRRTQRPRSHARLACRAVVFGGGEFRVCH